MDATRESVATLRPSHLSACTTGAAGLPAHTMTSGPACRNWTVQPPISIVLEWPSVTKQTLAGTALVRPNWFAATEPCGMIRTPSRRVSAAMAASKSTGAGRRFSISLSLGISYSPRPTLRSRPALTNRDKAWSIASRLPRSKKSFGVHTHRPLAWAQTRFKISSAKPFTELHPSTGLGSYWRQKLTKCSLRSLRISDGCCMARREMPENW